MAQKHNHCNIVASCAFVKHMHGHATFERQLIATLFRAQRVEHVWATCIVKYWILVGMLNEQVTATPKKSILNEIFQWPRSNSKNTQVHSKKNI